MCWWLLHSSYFPHINVFIYVVLKCNLTHHENKRPWKGPSSHSVLDQVVSEQFLRWCELQHEQWQRMKEGCTRPWSTFPREWKLCMKFYRKRQRKRSDWNFSYKAQKRPWKNWSKTNIIFKQIMINWICTYMKRKMKDRVCYDSYKQRIRLWKSCSVTHVRRKVVLHLHVCFLMMTLLFLKFIQ